MNVKPHFEWCWILGRAGSVAHPFSKRQCSPSYLADEIRLFPPSLQALAACGKAMISSITAAFPSVPYVQSAFFQSDPSSPALLLGVHVAILPLCLLLNFQQPLENLAVNTPPLLMTIERTGECTMRRICLPPFPVSCPGAIRCRTVCFCYAYCVPMRRATRSGSSDSFPCP
jgi:hypothetical protein